MSSSTQPQKRFKRKLTPFLCREMLYDYLTGEMDEERRAAVAACLESDRETQDAYAAIVAGIACAEALASAEPAPELMQALIKAESALSLSRRYSRWGNWPDALRWSIAAVATSAAVAFVLTLSPWRTIRHAKGGDQGVVLAQIQGDGATSGHSESRDREVSQGDESAQTSEQVAAGADNLGETSGDEEDGDPARPAPSQAPSTEPQLAGKTAGFASESPKPLAPLPSRLVSSVAAPPAQGLPAAIAEGAAGRAQAANSTSLSLAKPSSIPEPEPDTADLAAGKPKAGDAKAKGFVYRAWLQTADVDEITPKLKAKIEELGGEKAGEHELGWKRGNSTYFHFAVPGKSEQDLTDQLKAFGRVRISKDPHPRVMPDGQIRFILWVEADRSH
jgi:hypothetical protein